MASISGQDTSSINNVDGFFTTSGGGTATTTPTFTLESATTYFNNEVTITNSASYTNPQYKVVVTRNSVVINTIISTTSPIAIPDTSPVGLTRTVTVTAQEFGDFVESASAVDTYTKAAFSFRYWRAAGSADGTTQSSGWYGAKNFRVYSGAGQTGTVYPPDLTTNTSGEAAGYFVDTVYRYSTSYAKWKAFDSSMSSWHWTLSVPTAENFSGFHFDSTIIPTLPTQTSIQFRSYSNPTANYILIQGSNTGAFAGEETTLAVLDVQVGSDLIFNLG